MLKSRLYTDEAVSKEIGNQGCQIHCFVYVVCFDNSYDNCIMNCIMHGFQGVSQKLEIIIIVNIN